jgi:hypothetical protein
MSDIGTNERVLRSDVTLEESKRIEKVLRAHNISYFERWKSHGGLFKLFGKKSNGKCDILVHMDFLEEAKKALGEK